MILYYRVFPQKLYGKTESGLQKIPKNGWQGKNDRLHYHQRTPKGKTFSFYEHDTLYQKTDSSWCLRLEKYIAAKCLWILLTWTKTREGRMIVYSIGHGIVERKYCRYLKEIDCRDKGGEREMSNYSHVYGSTFYTSFRWFEHDFDEDSRIAE